MASGIVRQLSPLVAPIWRPRRKPALRIVSIALMWVNGRISRDGATHCRQVGANAQGSIVAATRPVTGNDLANPASTILRILAPDLRRSVAPMRLFVSSPCHQPIWLPARWASPIRWHPSGPIVVLAVRPRLSLTVPWKAFGPPPDCHHRPQPLLGLRADGNGLIPLLLRLPPDRALLFQLALDVLPLILRPPESLLPGDPFVRQLRL
jgi:hypothetical protein